MKLAATIGTLLALALFGLPAQAAIINGEVTGGFSQSRGGQFVLLTTPFILSTPNNTVGENNFESNDLYGFDEDQNIVLTSGLAVDALADGAGGETGPGVIPAGTVVDSHYVFFDPFGGIGRTQTGTVEFGADILGIIFSTVNLRNSDPLIDNGVTYLDPTRRELESDEDATWISGLREMSVDWVASNPGDYARILTVSRVPEPTTGLLIGLSTLALALGRRRASND